MIDNINRHSNTVPREKVPFVRAVTDSFWINDLAEIYLDQLNCARSLTVWLLYSYGEHKQLIELTFDPHDYESVDSAAKACLATELFCKYDKLSTGIDTAAKAIENGHLAEQINGTTNHRLRTDLLSIDNNASTLEQLAVLEEARKIIRSVIGDAPPQDITSFRRWGPGRSTVSRYPAVSTLDKFGVKPDMTASAFTLAMKMVTESPHWCQAILNSDGPCTLLASTKTFSFAEGNVAITVPKNAKTDRLICYEPHLNLPLQLNVGSFFRRSLRKRGIDLNDQSTNQFLARLSSSDGDLATVDLRMASDTLAHELVRLLLPEDWYHYLDRIRSRSTLWPDQGLRRNEKFASMGNGFTFELETLIFYSICKALRPSLQAGIDFSVYGDDIVVPTQLVPSLMESLSYAGFEINRSKTYATSFFRESCGEFAFSGRSLIVPRFRPRRSIKDQLRTVVNQIFRCFSGWFGYVPRALFSSLIKLVKPFGFPFGPDRYGDGHLIVPFDFARPQLAPRGWDGYVYHTYTSLPKFPNRVSFDKYNPSAAICASLSSLDRTVDIQGEFSLEKDFSRDVVYTDRVLRRICFVAWYGFLVR